MKNPGSTTTEELEEIQFIQEARYIMQTCKVISVINSDDINTFSVLSNFYCSLFYLLYTFVVQVAHTTDLHVVT